MNSRSQDTAVSLRGYSSYGLVELIIEVDKLYTSSGNCFQNPCVLGRVLWNRCQTINNGGSQTFTNKMSRDM